ncbi:hypothetical protein HaLaN_15945 [Haematococcus lacustris]|uniref:Uncharacterized protein n=1 Tax=Haematococcus lacustris TaxID=44745 RepID=A0A699Z8S7_HAELA|nr:hypothetical protein HaLaN_15945 [Haematococcus lacustris]
MQRLSKDGHAHSVTADSLAACSDYRSGPKLQPRVKVSPKAAAMNKPAAIMELPRGAPSLPEPWSHGTL